MEWTQWIKATTIDVATNDVDLGMLPKTLGAVAVTFTGPGASSAADWTVQLQEGGVFWGQKIGEEPATEDLNNEPRLITRVLAGSYVLVARSPDGHRQVSQALVLDPGQTRKDVKLEIPAGTASVSGAILNEIGPSLLLFSQDQTLSAKIDGSHGYYHITDLPAGDYFVGSFYLLDKAPWLASIWLRARTRSSTSAPGHGPVRTRGYCPSRSPPPWASRKTARPSGWRVQLDASSP